MIGLDTTHIFFFYAKCYSKRKKEGKTNKENRQTNVVRKNRQEIQDPKRRAPLIYLLLIHIHVQIHIHIQKPSYHPPSSLL